MNIGGYSAFSKELAKEQLQDIKRKTKAEQIIRKQKIKHLSNQTNEFRRKHEEKKKVHEGDEEKRRLRILKMRKIRQDSATEKFQRKPEKKTPIVKPEAKPSSLKDGNYNVAGHVIEIRNGVRVPSANGRRNTAQEPEQNNLVHVHQQKFQNTVYQPDSYLNHHLKNLFGDDRITEKQYSNRPVPSQQNIPPSLPNHHPDSMNISSSGTTSANQDILFIDRKSPTDSLCSNDSLHESPLEQKLLRSSLKGSSALKMASSSRKVTFSDSVEFNDGDVKPVFTAMSARVPLYQRRVDNTIPEPSTQITPSPSFTKVETPSITTEQLLDQLRQDALLPKYPSNEDFCYPDNVPIANQPSEKAMITDHSPSTQINATENSSNNDTSFADSLIDSIESDDTEELGKPQVPIITSASQSTNVTANTISPPPSVTYVPSYTTQSYVPNFVPRNTTTITNPYSGKSNIFTPSRPLNHVTKQENLNNPTTTSTTSHKQVDDQFRNESYSQSQQKTDTNTIEKYQMKSLGNKYDQSMQNHRAFEQPPFSTPVAKNTTHSDQFSHQSHQNYFSYVNHNPVHNSNSNVIKIHSDTVKPYLSDLLLEDRNNISEKQFEKQSYSDDDNDNDEPVFDQELDTQEDEFFKTIEASLASVTFNSVNNNKEKPTQDEMNKRPKNKPHGETESDSHIESHIIPTDSEKISTAVKDGTSIPVRVHSGNVRRGRIIVSANEKKRRTVSHFSPHPPPISKNESKVDFKSTSAPKKTNKETTQSKKHPSSPSTNAKKTPTKRNSFSSGHHMRQVYSPPTTTTLNKYSPRSKTTPSKDTNKPYRGTSPKSKPVQKQSSFTITKRDHNNNFLINNNNNNIAYYNDHVKQKQPSPQTPRKNSDYLSKQNRIALDKTPTDEEINKLWANVRNCLSTEAPEQAYSDTAFIAPKRVHHQRTFSGSLVRRVSNDSSLYQGGGNHHQATSNRRYGSHEALNRPNSNSSSSSSASSFSNRHALLPQRSNRILSPKLVIDRNSNLSNNSNTYFTRKKDHALSSHHKKDKEVTESMATFLALEELCNEQSLTPRQTEAVFKVSKSLIKKQMHAEESTKGLSALSIEERKVMDSLDRINDKLKRQDELQRTLSAKGR